MWLNLAIVVIYMLTMVGVGLYFSRGNKTKEDYYIAKRKIPSWAMGISIMATLISSMTFLAYPAAAYSGSWELLTPGLVVPVVLLLVVSIIIPFYRKYVRISAYEYFGKRFGASARVYSSIAFSLTHFAKMGFVLYLLATALAGITGWDVYSMIISLGLVTVFYTMLGGIEAVVWTDVIQGIVLLVGMVVSLVYILGLSGVGGAEILDLAWENQKFNLGSLEFNFNGETILVLVVYGLAWNFQKYTADQTIVQRYLSVKSDKAAVRATVMGALLCIPVWATFMLIGTSLWGYYELSGETIPAYVQKAEQVFPHFLITHIPAGLSGVIIAAMISAAMSTLSSDLNCLSAIVVQDYYAPLRPDATDQAQLRFGRISVLVFGILCVIIAIGLVQSDGTALSNWYTWSSIVSAGLAGLFILAFMTTRANANGAILGIVACVLYTAWATSTLDKNGAFDLGLPIEPINDYMIGVIGHIVLVAIGYGASYLFPPAMSIRKYTLWGWLEQKKQLTHSAFSDSDR